MRVSFASLCLLALCAGIAGGATFASGDLDPTFGQGGRTVVGWDGGGGRWSQDIATSLIVQADGGVVAVGGSAAPDTDGFWAPHRIGLLRLRANGSLATFPVSGKIGGRLGKTMQGSVYDDVEPDARPYGAQQPDGRIVVAVTAQMRNTYYNDSGGRIGILRFSAEGVADTQFGTHNGRTLTDAEGVRSENVRDVAVQPDGKIVVVGDGCGPRSARNASTGQYTCFPIWYVARHTANGSRDATFGAARSNGIAYTDFASSDVERATGVAIQQNGRIVVVGSAWVGGSRRIALVRYRTNGSLDTSFVGGGKVLTDFASSIAEYAADVAVQPDGKIVVVGAANVGTSERPSWRIALARYHANGSLDTSFDGDGKVLTAYNPWSLFGNALVLKSDGDIVVAGTAEAGSSKRLVLARYDSNGALDPVFGGDGRVFGPSNSGAWDVALQSERQIVVAGWRETKGGGAPAYWNLDYLVSRYFG